MYRKITSKTALNRLNAKYLPYKWDLNIYRGCAHNCQYCYAQYSHTYLENTDFFDDVFIKQNIVELLEKKLSSPNWKREVINLGGVTDSYQPVEAREKIMPEILKLLIKYKNPVTISTKSRLILRDFDLWNELSRLTDVSLSASITTFNEKISNKIEPGAAPPIYRLNVLQQFRKTNVNLGVLAMPILPYITDSASNLNNLFSEISKIPVDFVFCGLLNVSGKTRTHFLRFVEQEYPELYVKYLDLYKGKFAQKSYRNQFYKKVASLKAKFKIHDNYKKPKPLQLEFNILN